MYRLRPSTLGFTVAFGMLTVWSVGELRANGSGTDPATVRPPAIDRESAVVTAPVTATATFIPSPAPLPPTPAPAAAEPPTATAPPTTAPAPPAPAPTTAATATATGTPSPDAVAVESRRIAALLARRRAEVELAAGTPIGELFVAPAIVAHIGLAAPAPFAHAMLGFVTAGGRVALPQIDGWLLEGGVWRNNEC